MDITALTDFQGDLATAIAAAGAGVVLIFGATLVWPFITGWMAKYRKAGNGKAGS